MLANSPAQYGTVSRTFHWVTALLVIALLCVGLYMSDMPGSLAKLKLYNLHKSFGVTVLTLTVLRLCWHLWSKKPPLSAALKNWEKGAAHAVHFFLYAALLGMPLTGWLMSSAGGRPVGVFGLFTLPDLIGKDDHLRDIFRDIHGYLGYTLIGAIALHFSGAMKHHFLDHDNTLRKMLPFAKVKE